MKAVVLDAPYRFRMEDRPLPALKSGWALIKVEAAGICGSDIHFYTGELPLAPGSVRGHEIAGTIVDPGDTRLPKDQAVVVHPLLGCGVCPACQRAQQQLCANLTAIGGQHPGGFAEFAAAPLQSIYPFDANLLPFTQAALADCVAVAVHAMNVVGVKAGESAVVLGDGAIGLLLLQVALARGAHPVIVAGKHGFNLEIARQLGASLAFSATAQDPVATVQAAAGQVDVVFEAVGGLTPPLAAGLKMLRKGGRLATLGLTGAENVAIPWLDVVFGELSLIGVMGYGTFEGEDEMQQALELMQAGRIVLEPLITHAMQLQDVDRGFKAMLSRTTSPCIKVVILPQKAASHGTRRGVQRRP
jgi:2-desacetyl-2-hydroxyethyl bacteriochlorophyllide A dehydrogenase